MNHLLVYLSETSPHCQVFFRYRLPRWMQRFKMAKSLFQRWIGAFKGSASPLFVRALSDELPIEGKYTGISDANEGKCSECCFCWSVGTPSLPRALCLGPVVQPTNLWFWPTFWPHPSHWESLRLWFISHESHLFLPGRYVIITDLPAPSCWKQAGHIWIFHYSVIILPEVPQDMIYTGQGWRSHFSVLSIMAAGWDQWSDMEIHL